LFYIATTNSLEPIATLFFLAKLSNPFFIKSSEINIDLPSDFVFFISNILMNNYQK